jgi:cellulose 1,4-beta-cellobiosidase
VDNPYAGAVGYRNPDFAANVAASAANRTGALAAAMGRTATYPTGVWLDSIASINAGRGLRGHLDTALAQQIPGGNPVVVTLVLDDLPNRDCRELVSHGELTVANNGLARYKAEFVDPIAAILRDSRYASLRVVTVIEPGALSNLITSSTQTLSCQEANTSGAYVQGIQYVLNAFSPLANVYAYLDASHSYALGYDQNLIPVVRLFQSIASGTSAGFASVDGFAINSAGYSPVEEPFLTDPRQLIGGSPVFISRFYDFNPHLDEQDFVQSLYTQVVAMGFPLSTGILIDTSRNGWGGPGRPTTAPTATDLTTYVNAARIDRRLFRSNWCNQAGAGIGPRPQASPMPHVDAYVWVKPPGESDGASQAAAGQPRVGDPMCDPTYTPPINDNRPTGAMFGAPAEGSWFDAQFAELVTNASPPL